MIQVDLVQGGTHKKRPDVKEAHQEPKDFLQVCKSVEMGSTCAGSEATVQAQKNFSLE